MKILVTGGAGNIGSHFVNRIKDTVHIPLVIDNLSRGHLEAVPKDVVFSKTDLLDYNAVSNFINEHKPDAVVHFAAFAYVGESVQHPDLYYTNNVTGSINLIKACVNAGVKKFVFSSTCSLYGNPDKVPITEDMRTNPINPYAQTKLMIENILKDHETAFGMKYVSLRYFNAAGADESGLIGESHEPETHLIPLVIETALGKRKSVSVFGDDYNTKDGTCIRDYIHVNDIADAHLAAINFIGNNNSEIINLGTGDGYSVLEIIKIVEKISGRKVNYKLAERRKGDPAVLIADNKKAQQLLGWRPKYDIESIVKTAYNWYSNPLY